MQYHRRTEDQQQFALFDPPIPLDAGKLDVKQAIGGYLLAGGLFTSGMVCLALAALVFPNGVDAATSDWFAWRVVGATLFVVPMGLSFWSAWGVWLSVHRGFKQYDAFLFDVRQMWLDAAEDLRGQPAWTSHTEEAFAIDLPHVLTMALAITWDLNQQRGQRKLWTVDAMCGSAYVAVPEGNGETYLHFGKLSKPMAEDLGQVFARLGLIEGRRERAAGRWTATDANDTVETVLLNWKQAGLPLA